MLRDDCIESLQQAYACCVYGYLFAVHEGPDDEHCATIACSHVL